MRYLTTALLLTALSWPAAAATTYRAEDCQQRRANEIPADAVMVLRAGNCLVEAPAEVVETPTTGIQVWRGKQLTIVNPR
jgi:hypothetical protein